MGKIENKNKQKPLEFSSGFIIGWTLATKVGKKKEPIEQSTQSVEKIKDFLPESSGVRTNPVV